MRILHSLLLTVLLLADAFAATLTGRIVEDHSGSPTPSASVRVYKAGVRGLVADLETDSEGRFHATELPEGEYRIEISKPNHVAARLRVQLTANDASPLLIRLIRSGVITGHVTDSSGQPVPGAQVLAMTRAAAGRPLLPEFTPGRFAAVDERGRYRLFNLPPGQYFIALSYGASTFAIGSRGSASTPERLGSGVHFYPTSANPQWFTVTGGEEFGNIDFAVFPPSFHSVSGKVEFPSAPPERGRFWLALAAVDQPGLAVVVTQAETNGTFRFNSVPTGSYHLFVSGPTSARGSRGASLNPDSVFARARVDVGSHEVDNISIAPKRAAPSHLRSAPPALAARPPPNSCWLLSRTGPRKSNVERQSHFRRNRLSRALHPPDISYRSPDSAKHVTHRAQSSISALRAPARSRFPFIPLVPFTVGLLQANVAPQTSQSCSSRILSIQPALSR